MGALIKQIKKCEGTDTDVRKRISVRRNALKGFNKAPDFHPKYQLS